MAVDCRTCGRSLDSGVQVCLACGTIQDGTGAESIPCENHGSEPARGCCIVCGKPVCGDCATTVGGRFLCDTIEHQTVLREWAVVKTASSEFEGDMIGANLAQAGIETKVFSLRDHIGTFWVKECSIVRIMVPSSKERDAVNRLRELHLFEPR